jgi:hypothetical protein
LALGGTALVDTVSLLLTGAALTFSGDNRATLVQAFIDIDTLNVSVHTGRSLLLLETAASGASRAERLLATELRVDWEIPTSLRKVLVVRAGVWLTNWVWALLAVCALDAVAARLAGLVSSEYLARRAFAISSNLLGGVVAYAWVVVTLETLALVGSDVVGTDSACRALVLGVGALINILKGGRVESRASAALVVVCTDVLAAKAQSWNLSWAVVHALWHRLTNCTADDWVGKVSVTRIRVAVVQVSASVTVTLESRDAAAVKGSGCVNASSGNVTVVVSRRLSHDALILVVVAVLIVPASVACACVRLTDVGT